MGVRDVLSRLCQDDRGGPALEFGLVAPVVLVIMAGMTDISLAYWRKGQLANSVSDGAAYAILAGTSVTDSNIKAVVAQKLSLATSNVTVIPPACKCLSKPAPPTLPVTTAQACNTLCPDGSMSAYYVTITAQYTYTPVLPGLSKMSSTVLTETTQVRLQ